MHILARKVEETTQADGEMLCFFTLCGVQGCSWLSIASIVLFFKVSSSLLLNQTATSLLAKVSFHNSLLLLYYFFLLLFLQHRPTFKRAKQRVSFQFSGRAASSEVAHPPPNIPAVAGKRRERVKRGDCSKIGRVLAGRPHVPDVALAA